MTVPTSLLTAVPPYVLLAFAALAVLALPRRAGHAVAALATALTFVQAVLLGDGGTGAHLATTFLGFDVVFFNVDQFSLLMGVVVGFLATAAVLYAYGSEAPTWVTAFALLYVATTFGTIYAGDWLTLVFFWELTAVTSTLLVWQHGGEAVRAGYRYALFHGTGGTILLAAVVVHFVNAGTFLFSETAGIDPAATALAAIGIGINCGFIFLHSWLPDTYPRPHVAASVFLSVFTTKTAAYVMYRAFPEGGMWLAYLGGFMAVYGAFFALLQYDPRRLLSYHIQAQLGYMLAGFGLATAVGEFAVTGGFAHLFNNVLYKSLLFMAVGVVVYRTGVEDIRDMGGLWKVMPVTFLVYLVGAASITAVPGFNGFISKGMVLDSAHEVHNYILLLDSGLLWWLLVLGGVGTFMSFIKLGYYMFFHGSATLSPDDATPFQTAGMLLAAGACVFFGVFYTQLIELMPFTDLILSDEVYFKPYSQSHLIESAALLIAGFVGFFALKRPLGWLAHRMPDVDRVIFPAAFYLGRGSVWGVTELWAAVDRATMALAGATMRTASHPREALSRAGVDVEIRAGIGRSVLLLTLAAGVALFAFLLV
ncbi:monovalent cation/H+ antiporter subunit D [Halorubrum distributum JCM 13561]|uniref:Monovalent cation/H+ antiporter subunit D n=1 Tax=Halorubrum distributum JCM 13561 TaxID=1227483 RepID=M0NY39_9EURY|nr:MULTISPECIES: Na(+)/H(+) antiporter subunit D [Halorubrum distributum group]EMA62751.1 monovalent cation/H+ antiporter subunit D [Halorubrum litoreum JCM 13561]MDV7348387.1 Na(+)/H(+) antiporter subunit D [Halorubrum distributum]